MTLHEFISRSGVSQAKFAAELGVTQGAISAWLLGKRIPRPDQMKKIVDATGGEVVPNDFYILQPPSEAAE